jgi:hypothetical protein
VFVSVCRGVDVAVPVAGMCMFGDNPRTTNQYDNALQFSVAYTGAAPSGSLRVSFNGHRSIPFTADLTSVCASPFDFGVVR